MSVKKFYSNHDKMLYNVSYVIEFSFFMFLKVSFFFSSQEETHVFNRHIFPFCANEILYLTLTHTYLYFELHFYTHILYYTLENLKGARFELLSTLVLLSSNRSLLFSSTFVHTPYLKVSNILLRFTHVMFQRLLNFLYHTVVAFAATPN